MAPRYPNQSLREWNQRMKYIKASLMLLSLLTLITLSATSCYHIEEPTPDTGSTSTVLSVTQTSSMPGKDRPTVKKVERIGAQYKMSTLSSPIQTNSLNDSGTALTDALSPLVDLTLLPVKFPADLTTVTSIMKMKAQTAWCKYSYNNPKEKRAVVFQVTNIDRFDNVDMDYIKSLKVSKLDRINVYLFSFYYPNGDIQAYVAYYEHNTSRYLLESFNLSQEEFMQTLSSSINQLDHKASD